MITFVVGPTASGKSAWAMDEAERFGGALVNCDSVQFYKYFDIGANKPSSGDMNRVPHFLYGISEPDREFTAGDFRRQALRIIGEQIRDRPLYFVGGSGFYFQALEKGMFPVPPVTEEAKAAVQVLFEKGKLWEELSRRDPETASRLHANDSYRIRRAMEIILSSGLSLTEIQRRFESENKSLKETHQLRKIGLSVPRDVLRRFVTQRTRKMLDLGLMKEVEDLVHRGFAECKPMKSVGYKECLSVLRGELPPHELESAIVTSTMQLAKRQMTWFRRDSDIEWIEGPYS